MTEEVEIGKQAVQATERVGGTVGKERVRVEDKTDAEVTDASTGMGTMLPPSDRPAGEEFSGGNT